jgi:hypothetical protein
MVNRGIFDLGWSCREHTFIVCCLVLAQGVETQLTRGKVMYVRGPSGSLPPAGLGQKWGSHAGHTWLEVGEVGVVNVSPSLAGGKHPHWPSVTSSGMLGSQWRPCGGGQFIQYRSAQDYEDQIAIGSHQEHGLRAVCLLISREKLTSGMIVEAWKYINSPLTDSLRKRFDPAIYAKAVPHFADRLEGRGRSLAGVSRNKGWSIIASRAGNATEEVIRMTGLLT